MLTIPDDFYMIRSKVDAIINGSQGMRLMILKHQLCSSKILGTEIDRERKREESYLGLKLFQNFKDTQCHYLIICRHTCLE